jgi:hypothetical protein
MSDLSLQLDELARAGLARRRRIVESADGPHLIVEGRRYLAGAIPKRLGLPVILVVGLRLGCLTTRCSHRRPSNPKGSRSPAGLPTASIRPWPGPKRMSRP